MAKAKKERKATKRAEGPAKKAAPKKPRKSTSTVAGPVPESGILTISKEWTYTRASHPDSVEYLIHSEGTCPGYRIEISNWRIRKGVRSGNSHPRDVLELLWFASEEIKRADGCHQHSEPISIQAAEQRLDQLIARPETKTLVEKYPHRMQAFLLGILASTMPAKEPHQKASPLSSLLRSAQASPLGFTLMSLVLTTRQPHMIDSVRWPQTNPPSGLRHLDRDGFDGGKSTGIVAVPEGSDGVWCIGAFSACEIQATPAFHPDAVKAIAESVAKRLENRIQVDPQGSRQTQAGSDRCEYGSLVVFGDFEHVTFNKTGYDLRDANQAREILRLLAEGGHTSSGKSVTKAGILAHLEAKDLVTPNIEWRPSFAFKGKLKPLYDAIGCKQYRGEYWLK